MKVATSLLALRPVAVWIEPCPRYCWSGATKFNDVDGELVIPTI